MKSFAEQKAILIKFDETFNSSCADSCANRAVLLLKNREAQMTEECYTFNHKISKWPIEQAILNRPAGYTMMQAAIEYVESIELQVEKFNGII